MATMGDMALTLDCPRGTSSGPCGEPQAVWGAGEVAQQGLVEDVAYKKPSPQTTLCYICQPAA